MAKTPFFLNQASEFQREARFHAGAARADADELADMIRDGWHLSDNVETVHAYVLCRASYWGNIYEARYAARMARISMGVEAYGDDRSQDYA